MKRYSLFGLLLIFIAVAGAAQIIVEVPEAPAGMGFGVVGGGGGGGAATPPTFGAEIQRFGVTASAATTVITLTGAIAQGKRIVLGIRSINATQAVASVADSRSNSYTVDKSLLFSTTYYGAVVSAYAATALEVGDTITITWANASFTYRWGVVAYLNDCAPSGQPDQTASNSSFGTAVSASANTTATNTALFGIVMQTAVTDTYGSSSWTVSGADHDYGNPSRTNYVYSNATSSGAKNPGGTLSSTNVDWGALWVAYK
jgi:hypothetical protein